MLPHGSSATVDRRDVHAMRRWNGLWRRRAARETIVQAAKAALAAVLALLATQRLGVTLLVEQGTGVQAFLGPYAAVLTVTSTVRRSWTGTGRQAVLVVLGVLLAFVAGHLVPATAPALAAVVLVGLLLGRWRKLAPDGDWVAITALILLLDGSAARPDELLAWVLSSLVGAVIGAAVNTLVLPPLHLQGARDAVLSLTAAIAGELRTVADGVGSGWSIPDAAAWSAGARGLRASVARAHDAVGVGRESMRWNPRRRTILRTDSPLTGPGVAQAARSAGRTRGPDRGTARRPRRIRRPAARPGAGRAARSPGHRGRGVGRTSRPRPRRGTGRSHRTAARPAGRRRTRPRAHPQHLPGDDRRRDQRSHPRPALGSGRGPTVTVKAFGHRSGFSTARRAGPGMPPRTPAH